MKKLLGVLAVAFAALGFVGSAGAANGDALRQIIIDRTGTSCASTDAAGNHGSVGVGIAFDGIHLLASCYSDSTITAVSPVDGSQVVVHAISGASSLGALAWDNTRGVVWGCSAFSDIGKIDLAANTFTLAFHSAGCFDGLAYDGSDDTLWASADASFPVTHYNTDGTVLGAFTGSLGGHGNSGIAVGGPLLYLANDGGSQIYTSPKDFSVAPTLFASFPRRIEDLECDNVTFAGIGKGAIWSIDAYDNILNAWEIPAGSCDFGGGRSGPRISGAVNMVVRATSAAGTPVSFTVTAVDFPDGPVPVTCTPPSGSLFPLGVTTVTCTATDSDHNTTTKSFTVTSRNGVVDSGPSGSTPIQSATVAFSVSIPRSEARCSLDGAPEKKCSGSPLTFRGLRPGPHSFCIRGLAPGLIYDPTPDCISWSFDPPAPIVTITSSSLVGQSDLRITFTSSQPGPNSGSGFFCQLDLGPFKTCSSGVIFHGLAGVRDSELFHCVTVQAVSNFGLFSDPFDFSAGAWAYTPDLGAGVGCGGG